MTEVRSGQGSEAGSQVMVGYRSMVEGGGCDSQASCQGRAECYYRVPTSELSGKGILELLKDKCRIFLVQ